MSGWANPGLSALLTVAKAQPGPAGTNHAGFILGPRINAGGRIGKSDLGARLLSTDDAEEAAALAEELDALNLSRREVERAVVETAIRRVEATGAHDDGTPVVVVAGDDWHPGVVGIVAGRIRERVHRPVIAFAPDNHPGQLRGSARSVPGLHIRDVLATVDARQPGLIERFGGHAAAAGLSLLAAHLPAFQSAFDAEVRGLLRPEDLNGCLWSDGELEPADFSLETAEQLREAGPWGQGFPEPLFDGVFEVTAHRIMKDQHLKLWLRPPGMKQPVEAIAFHRVGDFAPGTARLRVAYKLDANEWRGERRLQLRVEHLEPA